MQAARCVTGSRSSVNCAFPRTYRSIGPMCAVQSSSRGADAGGHVRCSAAIEAASTLATATIHELLLEQDGNGLQRIQYQPQGWSFWEWRGRRIHYVQAGTQGPAVVLVHGYGASAYHWRYTVPELATDCRVFAVDLLGFGWSDKALVDYDNGTVWVEQLNDFVKEVVGGEPVVLAGNSLGGYASLATAAAHPEVVRGLVLLNGAGPFDSGGGAAAASATSAPATSAEQPWWSRLADSLRTVAQRAALYVAFLNARDEGNIQKVLQLVYADKGQCDADLVTSIRRAAYDSNAAEVFFRVNFRRKPPITVNTLLARLEGAAPGGGPLPLLLLWGDLDPWIVPSRAEAIRQLYPSATKVGLQSGHCPHDDSPLDTTAALRRWIQALPTPPMA